jgi:hypothetical protein
MRSENSSTSQQDQDAIYVTRPKRSGGESDGHSTRDRYSQWEHLKSIVQPKTALVAGFVGETNLIPGSFSLR